MLKIDLFCLENTEMFDCSVTLVFLALLVSGLHANQDHVEVLEPGTGFPTQNQIVKTI